MLYCQIWAMFLPIQFMKTFYNSRKSIPMKIKINEYYPNTSVNSNTNTTAVSDIPTGESFEEVLVLNQNALKAMAIDAMVAESTTGSVDPDAVNAAAIMKFRNTLASHIVAPIPDPDTVLHAPQPQRPATPVTSAPPSTNGTLSDAFDEIKEAIGGVFNSGALKCSEQLNNYFKEASTTYGVDEKLLKSIAYCESSFNPNNTSSSGAMGIMQLMPETAEYLGIRNAYDPRQNIMGGAKYFSTMLERYDGNIPLALAAYNAGPGNVDKYGGIPPFKETQNYVPKVLGYYNS